MEKINQSPPIVSVTPSDTTVYKPPLKDLRVGTTAGDIKVRSGGKDVVILNVRVGDIIPGEFNKVYATDTTAVGINAWQWDNH